MQLIDSNDPNDRRKASKHYQRMAKQAQRQAQRRLFWAHLTRIPHFTFSDMIFAALNAALLAAGWTYLLLR